MLKKCYTYYAQRHANRTWMQRKHMEDAHVLTGEYHCLEVGPSTPANMNATDAIQMHQKHYHAGKHTSHT